MRRKVDISIGLEPDQAAQLKALSEESRVSASQIAREAIAALLAKREQWLQERGLR